MVGRPAKRGRHLRTNKPKMGKPGRKRKRGPKKGSFGARVGAIKRKIRREALKKEPFMQRWGRRLRLRRRLKAIDIISRRTQPQWRIRVKVARLDRKVFLGGRVSSSWIAALAWDPNRKEALMYLLDGKLYSYKMKFEIYQGWYYAHSKGTYFWYKNIRNAKKYPYERLV